MEDLKFLEPKKEEFTGSNQNSSFYEHGGQLTPARPRITGLMTSLKLTDLGRKIYEVWMLRQGNTRLMTSLKLTDLGSKVYEVWMLRQGMTRLMTSLKLTDLERKEKNISKRVLEKRNYKVTPTRPKIPTLMNSLQLTDLGKKVYKICKRGQEKRINKKPSRERLKKHEDLGSKDAIRLLEQEENDLAKILQKVCSPYGDERKEKLNETSEILFSLGRLYLRKAAVTTGIDQKLNFIKAAALLHGARVRFEMHLRHEVKANDVCDTLEQMESNLLLSCKGILSATQRLVTISKNVKRAFKFHRRIEESELEIIPENIQKADAHKKQQKKISQVQYMLEKNTINFTCLMRYVAQKCADILRKPPCQFAIVGLGSLARREITLYSDFEHVIILEEGVQDLPDYESIKEYFRWFAVIFEIITIGLGETIIPSVGIKSLNDLYASDRTNNWFFDVFTPSRVSIDGMMPHACKTPLGRQELTEKKEHAVELILPVSKMSSLLTSVEDLKNGYNLKDVLRQSCFVFGCEALFCYFRRQALNVLFFEDDKDGSDSMPKITIDKVYKPVEGSKIIFGPHEVDSKSSHYRPLSAMFSYVGRIKKFSDLSSFQIIRNCFAPNLQHEMLWAFAVACELRMKSYAHGQGNRHRVRDKDFFPFVGESCFRNSVRQQYNLSMMSIMQIQSMPPSLTDFQVSREVHALMTIGRYEEACKMLRKYIEELENVCVIEQDADLLNRHRSSLALCCFRAAVCSQRCKVTQIFNEAKEIIKSLQGTQFENECLNVLFQIYRREGRKQDSFNILVKFLEREGDSIFTKFTISCFEFGRAIAEKFLCPLSAVDFCDKALAKYKGFHSQVAFKFGKALAMITPRVEWYGSKEFHDLAEDGRKEFCDVAVAVQSKIRDMKKFEVVGFFDEIFCLQMICNWWEDGLATMESSQTIRKSKYQSNSTSHKVITIFCAESAAKYLLKSRLEKAAAKKFKLFRKCFQSLEDCGDSKNFFARKMRFYYHLNVRTFNLLSFINVDTEVLLKYSREMIPQNLENFEKRLNIMTQLFIVLAFYQKKLHHRQILDVADDLIGVLGKFYSLLHHPLFANALHGISKVFHVQTRNLFMLAGPFNKHIYKLMNLKSMLGQICNKVKLNFTLAGESPSRKRYREAIELWFNSDFEGCIYRFWNIINFKKAEFFVWARSVTMFYHSIVALHGMYYIYNDSGYVLFEEPVAWPFAMVQQTHPMWTQ